MEYQVLLKNKFNRQAVLDVLRHGRAPADVFGTHALHRPYLPRTAPHLSPTVLGQLHRAQAGRPPVHESADFALYFLSSKGGMEQDYYYLDNRWLIYDRRVRWAYWQEPLPTLTGLANKTHAKVLDGPLDDLTTNSPFGKVRGGVPHGGTDYPVRGGTEYHATADGQVVRAEFSTTYGNVVVIDHGNAVNQAGRVYTLYAHSSKLLVKKGQKVKVGDVVALTGNTGTVKPKAPGGYHGHYEVICTKQLFGTYKFYDFKEKRKPNDLRLLLLGQ